MGSGGIKHHISMFPGKQNTFLNPSHGITAVITAIISGASVPSVKVLSSVSYIFRVVYSAVFSLFVPYLWLNNYQKCDEDIICRKSSRCLFSQWLWGVCEQRLSQLLINETGDNVQSDLFGKKRKKKKKGRANIIVAAWVNFCTSTCIYLHEPLPYWLVLLYDYINQVKSCLKFVLFVNCQVLIGQVLLALHDDLHHFKIWFHLIFMVPQLCFPSDSRYLSLLSSDVCALHLSPAFSELHLNFQAG